MTTPVILDCDPGHDDAIALLLALAQATSPSLALAGPADLDEPLLHPRLEIDPRLDLHEPARAPRPGSSAAHGPRPSASS